MLKKWNRIGSMFIDTSIITLMVLPVIGALFYFFTFDLFVPSFNGNGLTLIIDLLKIFVYLLVLVYGASYFNYFIYKKLKNTFGKMMLKVHIVDKTSSSKKLVVISKEQFLKREVFKYSLILATFGLYVFVVIFMVLAGNEEMPHDKYAKTKVEVWV